MGEIVNLRRVKKQRARDQAAREAESARARHGRTPGEKAVVESEAARARRAVDQARIEE